MLLSGGQEKVLEQAWSLESSALPQLSPSPFVPTRRSGIHRVQVLSVSVSLWVSGLRRKALCTSPG